jgi:4'-phosphopantetheinyl transferase
MSAYNIWKIPPENLVLAENEVHVWFAELDKPEICVHQFEEILSIDERQKAGRFAFKRDRINFIIAHGVLRTIIGRYFLSVEPSKLKFCYGVRGKPYLSEKFANGELSFNQADSNGMVLYAFAKNREVGIDIEYMRPIADAQQIVDGSFSEYERIAYNSLPEGEKHGAFYKCWTRKEAFIKAIGEGLYFLLDRFDVSISPDRPAKIISINGKSNDASSWALFDIEVKQDFAAAFSCEGLCEEIKYWIFPHSLPCHA